MAVFNGTLATDEIAGTAAADTINGLAGDDDLFGEAGADSITGGAHDDFLVGGAGNDTLRGDTGFDFFYGEQGNDLIDGGSGPDLGSPADIEEGDLVSYFLEGGKSGVTVNLATGTATDTFGSTDTLVRIEWVDGSEFADRITGDGNDNRFTGFDGKDTMDGGGGTDTLDYWFEPNEDGFMGIVADMALGKVRDAYGFIDTISGIERIRGTNFADELRGDAKNNWFDPHIGSDYVNGGGGSDTVSYGLDVFRGGLLGVDVDLTLGRAIDTVEYIDTLVSIENVVGSAFGDVIRGNNLANSLDGDAGDDILKGAAGNDKLVGGDYPGNDFLFGGQGNDRLDGGRGHDILRGGFGNDTFVIDELGDEDIFKDFRTGTDKVDVSAFGFGSKAEVLALIEIVSDDTALLVLADDTIVEFVNIDTSAPFLVAGDIII